MFVQRVRNASNGRIRLFLDRRRPPRLFYSEWDVSAQCTPSFFLEVLESDLVKSVLSNQARDEIGQVFMLILTLF